MDSSLKSVFVEVVLRCRLAMASSSSNCVFAVQRVAPKPRITSSDAGSSSDEGTAAIDYFLGPIGFRGGDVRAIAAAMVGQGRIHFTHSRNPLERRVFLQRFLSMYHLDNYLGSAAVAAAVAH